jgi:hypothetical protein
MRGGTDAVDDLGDCGKVEEIGHRESGKGLPVNSRSSVIPLHFAHLLGYGRMAVYL